MKENKRIVRVVECGGSGYRRADVAGRNISQVFSPRESITSIRGLIRFATGSLAPGTVAVAYSVAGVIKDYHQVVLSPNQHVLDGADLGGLTKRAAGLPACVINDMEAAVTGMHLLFPELRYFLGMTWSSGIGVRIWKDGILSDSEGGHIRIDYSPFAPLCGCGHYGCAEAVIGGCGVKRRVAAELSARGMKAPDGEDLCAFIDKAYLADDPWAIDIYRLVALGMGLYLASLQTLLRLPAIVFKGTFGKRFFALPGAERSIREVLRRNLIKPAWEGELKFYQVPGPPKLINDGDSFLGAAKLALDLI